MDLKLYFSSLCVIAGLALQVPNTRVFECLVQHSLGNENINVHYLLGKNTVIKYISLIFSGIFTVHAFHFAPIFNESE